MDVKFPIAQSSDSALTKYQQAPQILHRINIPPPSVYTEDIVEIENRKRPANNTQFSKYKFLDNDRENEKGKFIDIRV